MTQDKIEATAKALGLTVEQVREVLQFEGAQQGTWTTTTRGIVTHEDGRRHWSTADCDECD